MIQVSKCAPLQPTADALIKTKAPAIVHVANGSLGRVASVNNQISEAAAEQLQQLINKMAEEGWSYQS